MLQVSRLVGESRFVFNSLCEPRSTLLCGNKAPTKLAHFSMQKSKRRTHDSGQNPEILDEGVPFLRDPRGLCSAHTSEADLAAARLR